MRETLMLLLPGFQMRKKSCTSVVNKITMRSYELNEVINPPSFRHRSPLRSAGMTK
jgi:hypothetical protein